MPTVRVQGLHLHDRLFRMQRLRRYAGMRRMPRLQPRRYMLRQRQTSQQPSSPQRQLLRRQALILFRQEYRTTVLKHGAVFFIPPCHNQQENMVRRFSGLEIVSSTSHESLRNRIYFAGRINRLDATCSSFKLYPHGRQQHSVLSVFRSQLHIYKPYVTQSVPTSVSAISFPKPAKRKTIYPLHCNNNNPPCTANV